MCHQILHQILVYNYRKVMVQGVPIKCQQDLRSKTQYQCSNNDNNNNKLYAAAGTRNARTKEAESMAELGLGGQPVEQNWQAVDSMRDSISKILRWKLIEEETHVLLYINVITHSHANFQEAAIVLLSPGENLECRERP